MSGGRNRRISKSVIIASVVVALIVIGSIIFSVVRNAAREKTIASAVELLDSIELRVKDHLDMVETVTNGFVPVVLANMQPDSLMAYTRRVVEAAPDINGCSITTEPDYFPHLGMFSAYSVREKDSITTVREGQYDYYSK